MKSKNQPDPEEPTWHPPQEPPRPSPQPFLPEIQPDYPSEPGIPDTSEPDIRRSFPGHSDPPPPPPKRGK